MDYKEFEYSDRVYILPVDSEFEAIEKQPEPDVDAVFALSVGEDCPMPEERMCIGIDDRNLAYCCKHLSAYCDKTDGAVMLDWLECSYNDNPQRRSVKMLRTAPNCNVDEFGCIHPAPGSAKEVTVCKYLVGYVPSSLLLPHHHIVCAFLKPIARL
jgi:hypothetical protein